MGRSRYYSIVVLAVLTTGLVGWAFSTPIRPRDEGIQPDYADDVFVKYRLTPQFSASETRPPAHGEMRE